VVKNLITDGVDNALRNLSSGMQITGGTIRGGRTGMDLQAGHDRQRHAGRAHHHGHPRPRARTHCAGRRHGRTPCRWASSPSRARR
jgi:hypothetical protein